MTKTKKLENKIFYFFLMKKLKLKTTEISNKIAPL
jgi:hypothetical protein